MAKLTVLTIDDEEHILELLKYNLENNNYKVLQADSAEKGLNIIEKNDVDIILLDLMLPGIDGLDFLKLIRAENKNKNIPVIMLTAKNDEIDTVLGLEMGADDYIGKPFGIHELLARMKAVLRRVEEKTNLEKEDIIKIDSISINRTNHEVLINGETINLALKEFELLYLLAKNRGRVFEREYLLEKIWGYDYYGETRTVDVHIRNIRKKIEENDNEPKYIITVRGVGYKFM